MQRSVNCKWWWEVEELKEKYPDQTRLVSWPYSVDSGIYIVIITERE